MIQTVFEITLFFLFIAVVVTQVVIPAKQGTPLFPIFLTKRAKLEGKVADANETVVEATLQKQAATARSKAGRIRTSI